MKGRSAAAQTAFGPMVMAACEQYTPVDQRLLSDDLAVRLLPFGQRFVVRAARWPRVRALLIRVTESMAPGIWGGVVCRKRYADDKVTEAVAAGLGQVVILGAGLDTRGYRLVFPPGVRIFEVDLPANVAYKRRRLRAALGADPERVSLVPVDLEVDDLPATLVENGFAISRPALFVWEAVTQYLTEDAVRRTMSYLGTAAPGSRLLFTYVRQDFLDGTNVYGAPQLRERMTGLRRVWRFGIAPDRVGALLREYGWVEREQVGRAEYEARYLAPVGREMPVSEIELFVHAEKG